MRPVPISVLLLSALLGGCSSLFPHGEEKVISHWNSFDEVMAAYEQVVPMQTTQTELEALKFSPEESPNVRILNHFEILNRVAPHQALGRDDLPPGLLDCISDQGACRAYEVKVMNTENKRYGNFLADFFNFRRKTQIRGWAFNAVFVLDDGLVIYKLWKGTPQIDEYREKNNPLGPLQGIGDSAVSPTILY